MDIDRDNIGMLILTAVLLGAAFIGMLLFLIIVVPWILLVVEFWVLREVLYPHTPLVFVPDWVVYATTAITYAISIHALRAKVKIERD